jgi:hypothetical protein
MAVAFRTGIGNLDTSISATTVPFSVPGTVIAGDIWICSAGFRAGSTVTISGVPASFHLILRVDAGSGTTVATSVSYWYLVVGGETGTSWQTITLSAASKHATIVDGFSGCNTTTPIVVGSVVSGVGTTSATTASGPGAAVGQGVYGVDVWQGGANSGGSIGYGGGTLLQTENVAGTTGGSASSNVGIEGVFGQGAISSGTASRADSLTTQALLCFTLDVSAVAGGLPQSTIHNTARQRAANYCKEAGSRLWTPNRRIFVPA